MPIDAPGSSLVWIDASDAAVAWRTFVERGDLTRADALFAGSTTPLASEARSITHRLRHEWSLTADAMYEKLVAAIPNATCEQLESWTTTGKLESKMIDGVLRYFRREPRNLFLFDLDARARQQRAAGEPVTADRHDSTSPIVPHLIDVLKAADASPAAREVMPIRTRYFYTLTVKADRPLAKEGSIIRAWLPYPQAYRQQRDITLIECEPAEHFIAPEGSPQRTIYFKKTVTDPSQPIRFTVTFEYATSAVCDIEYRPVEKETHWKPVVREADLAERSPHIAFTPEVRAIVQGLSADSPDQVTLAYRLWNWVDDNIPWRAEHEYCLIPSIIEQSLRVRRGDCGVAALTLITLCRCAGIPARWQSGWTTEPSSGGNMHDWTELFLDGDWVPVDPSYGKKRTDDPIYKDRVRDFYFGGLDRYRLIINTDYGRELDPPMTSLRAEPLDFQRGEIEIDGRVLYYDEWDWSFRFERIDL